MSRRIDIEITSLSQETATWRAAGAKLPKGNVALSLLPSDSKVGAIYRAEIEQYMEGIEVVNVTVPKAASPVDPRNERIEIIPTKKDEGAVTVTYAPKGKGPRGNGERRNRNEKSDRNKRPARKPRAEDSSDRSGRPNRPPRGERRERPTGPLAPVVLTTHRNALLATLSPEQLPVAEELIRGGVPGVRAAIGEQNKNAVAQGRPTVDAVVIERIADDLVGKVNLAVWKDRAAGAQSMGRSLRLRDLRAVVTAAKTVNLDDEGRALQKELQDNLKSRLDHLRTQWNEKLDKAVTDNDPAVALELVARPPDMSARVSAEMATKVVAMVSAALSADQSPEKWKNLVELAVNTSIRRNIKPSGIPQSEDCQAVAIHNAGAIPELAKLLGMKVPPPPPPAKRPVRRPAAPRA
jgi:hypothetical protein